MNFLRIALLGLSALSLSALAGCGAAPADESVGVDEEAATATVNLNAIDFGNWTKTGIRTPNDQTVGTIGGVEHAAYYVFDLSSVAGRTVTNAEIVVNNAPSGFRENITSPKPGLRVPFKEIGTTTEAELTTGNNDRNVYAQLIRGNNDFSYFYHRNAPGIEALTLLIYDTDRIPNMVKAAKKGTHLLIGAWPSNVNNDTKVNANGTGDQFIFRGVTTTPVLRLTLQ